MAWLTDYASKYSMLLVLLGLCVLFSLATVAEQQPSPPEAAHQVQWQIGQAPEAWSRVLVVSSGSSEDEAFAFELKRTASALGVDPSTLENAWVTGTPQDARRAIAARDTPPVPSSIGQPPVSLPNAVLPWKIVSSPDTRGWILFDGLQQKFPNLNIEVIAPEATRWPNFLKSKNLINIVNQIVVIAILAVGMTLVILTGGIDLSVGSLIALSAVLCTRAIRDWGGGEDATVFAMILCGSGALAVCALCGTFNGMLIMCFQIPPFIATLSMMLIASGFAFLLSQGQSIDAVPQNFVWLGRGTLMGVPIAVAMMLGIYAVAHFVMTFTTYGRSLYAIGGNAEAARLCGIRVRQWIASTYALSGLLAGLGGLVMASRLRSGDAKYGTMYELYVIAAVVVGGTSLRGGYGTVVGTLIGALIIAVIENGMNLVQIESYMQKVVFGAVILGAVLLDRRSRKLR